MPNELVDMVWDEISMVDRGACGTEEKQLATAVLVKSKDGEKRKPGRPRKDAVKKDGEVEDTGYGEMDEEGKPVDPADADMHGLSFDAALAAVNAEEYAEEMLEGVRGAIQALHRSVHSILDDEEIADPEAALKATFDQFREHMAGMVPEAMEKAISDSIAKALNAGSASNTPTDVKGNPMSEDVTKALESATAKIADLEATIAKSFSAEEAEFMAKMDGEAKDKFKGMTPEERKKLMEKECGKMTKRDDLPEDIRKRLDDAEKMEKRLAALEAEREFETFKKRANDCGLASDAAKHLQVIAKASPESLDFVEKLAKAAQEVEKRSPLFKELGTDNGADASTASAQLVAKAHDIEASEKITFAKAFTDACNRNPELYKAYCAESRS